MPFDKSKYPADWKKISHAIRERAGARCECEGECGLHHDHRCTEHNGDDAQWAKGKVVLTVAHLNHTESDCRPENLKAMCQRCHLRYDSKLHQQHAAQTRREKKAHADLFGRS